jgi:hypothetical protein
MSRQQADGHAFYGVLLGINETRIGLGFALQAMGQGVQAGRMVSICSVRGDQAPSSFSGYHVQMRPVSEARGRSRACIYAVGSPSRGGMRLLCTTRASGSNVPTRTLQTRTNLVYSTCMFLCLPFLQYDWMSKYHHAAYLLSLVVPPYPAHANLGGVSLFP